jgi:hypothetical protein
MSNEDQDLPRKRARNQKSDRATAREWYPWQDRIVSLLLIFQPDRFLTTLVDMYSRHPHAPSTLSFFT